MIQNKKSSIVVSQFLFLYLCLELIHQELLRAKHQPNHLLLKFKTKLVPSDC